MCGGGPKGPAEEDKKAQEQKHQENLALQREQMEEQKRQFELQRQDQLNRYNQQKAEAKAAPPPKPNATAAVDGLAIDDGKSGRGRKKYRNPVPQKNTKTPTLTRTDAAKTLYIGS